jgi:hypothetical protein
MINDDKPLIKITEKGAFVYGTPWNGKHKLGTNAFAPLSAICVLTRSEENHINKTDKKSIYPLIIQQTHRPKSFPLMAKTLMLVDKLALKTDFYILGCNMELDAAKVAYDGMSKNKKIKI